MIHKQVSHTLKCCTVHGVIQAVWVIVAGAVLLQNIRRDILEISSQEKLHGDRFEEVMAVSIYQQIYNTMITLTGGGGGGGRRGTLCVSCPAQCAHAGWVPDELQAISVIWD